MLVGLLAPYVQYTKSTEEALVICVLLLAWTNNLKTCDEEQLPVHSAS